MKLSDLRFDYPENLVATEPRRPSRVAWIKDGEPPQEISLAELCERIPADDILVINDTKVLHRRVFAGELEILFLRPEPELVWQVLMPSKKLKINEVIELPMDVRMTLLEKGRPQRVRVSRVLTDQDFEKYGELPLPPYIQKARGVRHNQGADENWYQTAWAEKPGSLAAPTASLHFQDTHLARLQARGVQIKKVTLHVGLGTFLPVLTEDLDQHPMHFEELEVKPEVWQELKMAKQQGRHIWALGTTAVRALETAARGPLRGETNLLIQPGFKFQMVDRLLTNFHQPESTLLALVAAFSDLEKVKASYAWAIEKNFRLFSYGDLSVWIPGDPQRSMR